MRTRIAIGTAITLLLVAVMAFGALGSGAWFTAEKTQSYYATTGTLKMQLTGELQSQENLAPGDEVPLGELTLSNIGTEPYKLRFMMETTEGADLANVLQVTITSDLIGGSYGPFPIGALHNIWLGYDGVNGEGGGSYPWTLCKQEFGASNTVEFDLTIPENVGNEFQGKKWVGTLHIQATQLENPGWSEDGK